MPAINLRMLSPFVASGQGTPRHPPDVVMIIELMNTSA